MLKTAEEYLKERFPNADKLDWFKPVVSALNAARIEAIKELIQYMEDHSMKATGTYEKAVKLLNEVK